MGPSGVHVYSFSDRSGSSSVEVRGRSVGSDMGHSFVWCGDIKTRLYYREGEGWLDEDTLGTLK